MDPDLIFVLGLGIFAMVFPLVVNAFSTSGKTLRPAAIAVLIGGSMILWASSQKAGGYSLNEVPRLIKELLN